MAFGKTGDPVQRQVFYRLVVATLPAALLEALFLKPLRSHFPSATSAAFFLVINGIFLWIGDGRRGFKENRGAAFNIDRDGEIVRMTWGKCLFIGLAQSLALIPGFSRSGMSIVAGLFAGLSYEAAAHFAFLLANPHNLGSRVGGSPSAFPGCRPKPSGPCLGRGYSRGDSRLF